MIEKIKQSRLMWPVKKVYKYLRFSRFAKPKFFLNNSKGADKVCIILAGYKSFTWEIVFKRIKTFCPEGIDVCIASSGVFSGELKNIAEKNGWSYAAFKRNCVTQVLNSAIKLFPDAKGIFKIDEDIFITEGFFDEIPACLEKAKKDCFPGFCAPLIPVNGYGYTRILQKLNLQKEYENRFEFPKISAGPHMQIESNPDAAKFFWGEGDFVPQIDALNRMLKSDAIRKNKTENTVCGDVCVGEEGGGVQAVSDSLLYRSYLFRTKNAGGSRLVSSVEWTLHGVGRNLFVQSGDKQFQGYCRFGTAACRTFEFRPTKRNHA